MADKKDEQQEHKGEPRGTDVDPRSEQPPEAAKGTPKEPAQTANPDEVTPSPDFPNYMTTTGLSAAEKARVEGTVIDGASGANVLGVNQTTTPDRAQRFAAATREQADKRAKAQRSERKGKGK